MKPVHTDQTLYYHGCETEVGERILAGDAMQPSERPYDWLGSGIYFWENDPLRAWEWARSKEDVEDPFIIGAVVALGNCLDLTTRKSHRNLESAYKSLENAFQSFGIELPVNKKANLADNDYLLRYLDCIVINHLHTLNNDKGNEAYDTVRGPFPEGVPVYPGALFRDKTHVQIAVRNPECILGVFRMRQP